MVFLLSLLSFVAVAAGVFALGLGVPIRETLFGASLLFPDAPGITADMVLAAKALRKLTGELRALHTRLTETLLGLALD